MQMHKYSLQPTTELKTVLQIIFWKCSERKGCAKSSKIPHFLTLQACIPQFPTSAKTGSNKNASFEFSEIVGRLPAKGPQWSHLIKLAALLLETKRL